MQSGNDDDETGSHGPAGRALSLNDCHPLAGLWHLKKALSRLQTSVGRTKLTASDEKAHVTFNTSRPRANQKLPWAPPLAAAASAGHAKTGKTLGQLFFCTRWLSAKILFLVCPVPVLPCPPVRSIAKNRPCLLDPTNLLFPLHFDTTSHTPIEAYIQDGEFAAALIYRSTVFSTTPRNCLHHWGGLARRVGVASPLWTAISIPVRYVHNGTTESWKHNTTAHSSTNCNDETDEIFHGMILSIDG